MVLCTRPECQTTAGCQCGLVRAPPPNLTGAAVVDWSKIRRMTIGGEEEYWVKLYRLSDELRRHLAAMPVVSSKPESQ